MTNNFVSKDFILSAQALDNVSSDPVSFYGEQLGPDDAARRQQAQSSISDVTANGKVVHEQDGVQLKTYRKHFVLEVWSAERDEAGRIAPIVCYGDYGATPEQELGSKAATAVEDFATRIGRSLEAGHFELARSSFDVLKKKSQSQKRIRVALTMAVILFLVAVAWGVAQANR